MLYYRVDFKFKEKEEEREINVDDEESEFKFIRKKKPIEQMVEMKKITTRTNQFNTALKGKAMFHVAEICSYNNTVTICAIYREREDIEPVLNDFLVKMDFEIQEYSIEEIIFNDYSGLIESSDYVTEAEEHKISKIFNINEIMNGRYGRRGIEWYESPIVTDEKKEVYKSTEDLVFKTDLCKELDRIYAGSAKKNAVGHPVHYIISTDDYAAKESTKDILCKALTSGKRIDNGRCNTISFSGDRGFDKDLLDNIYYSNKGGIVFLEPEFARDDQEDCENVSAGKMCFENLCEIARKYRNTVQTVFCLPKDSDKIKSMIFDIVDDIQFLEFNEDLLYGRIAEDYIAKFPKKDGLRANSELTDKIEFGKGYSAMELEDLYNEWLADRIKNEFYPQYREVMPKIREFKTESPKSPAYDRLMEMIGLDSAKKVINQAIDFYKAQKILEKSGKLEKRPSMHMCFTGDPGTAKTTVARLFGEIMFDKKILSSGHVVEVGRSDLVGKYVGWTAPTVKKKFKEAKGGILFIDEAYSLVDDKDGLYGDEAINTIVQEMENHRDDVIVIFAGYKDKMEGFIKKNPGLRSRIAFHVQFNNYNTDELVRIAKLQAKDRELSFTEGAIKKLNGIFDKARVNSDFGNGRFVRNVIERARMAQMSRVIAKGEDNIVAADFDIITEDDIEDLNNGQKSEEKKQIGFCI